MVLTYLNFIISNMVPDEEVVEDTIYIPIISKTVNIQHEIPILQEDKANATINTFKITPYETIDFLKMNWKRKICL